MKDTKLVELLSSLDSKNRRKFREFYYPQLLKLHSDESLLRNYLLSYMDSKDPLYMDRTHIQKSLFPKANNAKKSLAYATSNLFKALQIFVLTIDFVEKKNPTRDHITLLEYFQGAGLGRNTKSLQKRLYLSLDKMRERDEDYHLWEFRLIQVSIKEVKAERHGNSEFNLINLSLDNYYLENKLRLLVEAASRKKIIQAPLPNSILEGIILAIHPKEHLLSPGARIYYFLYKMLTEEFSNEYFQKVYALLSKHQKVFSNSYVKAIYEYLMNQCIAYINFGDNSYADIYINFVQILQDRQMLLEQNQLSPTKFLNIIGIGLKANRIEWTEEFCRAYTQFIPEEMREPLHGFAKGSIAFHIDDFKSALRNLNGINFKDMYYRLNYDKLLLQIYYELGELDALISLSKSLKKYISREKKLSHVKKRQMKSFISYLNDIAKHKSYSPGKLKTVHENLSEDKFVIDRDWLMEKITE